MVANFMKTHVRSDLEMTQLVNSKSRQMLNSRPQTAVSGRKNTNNMKISLNALLKNGATDGNCDGDLQQNI